MADSAWIQAEGYLRGQEESDLVSEKRVQIEQLLSTYIYTVMICVFHLPPNFPHEIWLVDWYFSCHSFASHHKSAQFITWRYCSHINFQEDSWTMKITVCLRSIFIYNFRLQSWKDQECMACTLQWVLLHRYVHSKKHLLHLCNYYNTKPFLYTFSYKPSPHNNARKRWEEWLVRSCN